MSSLSSHANIRSLTETPEWQSLRPNFPNGNDLLPQQLTPEQTVAIGDAVSELAQAKRTDTVSYPFGTLTPFTGYAEQKSSYRLRNPLGTMVVHVLRFPTQKPSISPSPFLTRVYSNPTQNLFEYSDPRTYFTLPWSDETSVSFQEDGGTALFAFGLASLSRRRAERNIRVSGIDLQGVDLKRARFEMSHVRHHLHKTGHVLPLLIDVPVVSREKSA